MNLDPVLLEILNNKVAAAAEEMSVALRRTSRSLYVKEAGDFCTGLLDGDGWVFAYPPKAMVPFQISIEAGPTIRAVADLEEGDVIITNDPYLSDGLSTHLPDLHLITPYHHRGRLVCYGWCFIHSNDVGGRVPSSISPSNTEIFQEGLRIPPMKLVRRGVLNEDLFAIYKANVRTPEANMGDIKAMLGALETGRRRVAHIIERHGVETFVACQSGLQAYTAAKARAVLRRIPDGDYEFWDYMDDDLLSPVPLRVRVRMTVADGRMNLDLTGTDPQVAAAYNVPTMGRRHEWLTMRLTTFLLTHDPSMAMNGGLYRHISVTNPPGTVLNAEFPDAVGVRAASARRLNDAITGALIKTAPGMMAAPTCGHATPCALAEYEADGAGRTVSVLEPLRGGMGASDGQDGVDVRDSTMSNMNNHPVEKVEADAGVIIREYDVCPDSGGPGRWRGGMGQLITIEVLRDGGVLMARGMERMRFQAWGVAGGRPGGRCRVIRNRGRRDERDLPKIDLLAVDAGDRITIMNPGASGYGDPYLRDPEKVLADVEQGFVSRAAAAREYGVVVGADGAVDEAATRRLRGARDGKHRCPAFDFGREREAWETVFDDAVMGALNRELMALPKAVRQATRRRIFEHAVPDLPATGSGRSLADAIPDAEAARARLADAMEEVFGARLSLT